MSLNGGYAMIKYNSTQEELQFAYRSKKPVLFYDENQRSHWAVIEETATESVDEETQEPITLYEYSYRLIDEASSVVANPTLSGNESTLNGLEVDGTKYKVGGGVVTLDDIVDKNGNKRFIEGEGSLLVQEGFNVSYNKWSLSGTHLMLVLVFSTTKVIEQNSFLVNYNLPDYIMNKIIPFEFNDWVEIKRIISMDVNKSSIEFDVSKFNGVLRIRNLSDIPIGRNFRVQFDLLIDSE